MEERKNNQKLVLAALVLGLCFLAAAVFVSWTIYKIKQAGNTLSVTGSAKEKVISDSVKWRSEFTRQVFASDLSAGYAQMKKDQKVVNDFMKENGVKEDEMSISPVFMDQVYKYDQSAPREYVLRQNVVVQSSEVDKITALAKNVQKLIDQGVVFATQSLEYYYSKLPEMRVNLLSSAVRDAKARADKIAESSGKKVSSVQSASMGVVQVLTPNSVEISDYGTYDTSSIEKEIMVTVKVVFKLE